MVMPSQAHIRPVLLRTLQQWPDGASVDEVVQGVTLRFPELTPGDLAEVTKIGANKWKNRVMWARLDLVHAGYVDKSIWGVWKLTEAGIAAAMQDEPDFSPTSTEGPESASHKMAEPAADNLSTTGSADGPQIAVLPNRPAQIAEELDSLAKDGQKSAEFEQIIADALSFLGFETKVIGGSGKTDVVAIAPLGPLRFKVVIDAKTTSNNTVGNHLIDWLAIKKHKDDEQADHACVIGRAFSGGVLRTQAEEFEVALLKAEDLAEMVLVHSHTPVSLSELRTVFATIPDTSPAIAGIRLSANHRERRLRLIKYLLRQIDQFNREQEDIVMAKPDMMWAAVAASPDQSIKGTTRDDVVDALHLLETIGVLAKSNGDGYVSQTSLDGAMQMLTAVGALAQERNEGEQLAQTKNQPVSQ